MSGYSYQDLWLGNALDHLVDRRDCLLFQTKQAIPTINKMVQGVAQPKVLIRISTHRTLVQDRCGATALHLASENGHVAVVSLLVAHNARLDVEYPLIARLLPLHPIGHYVPLTSSLPQHARSHSPDAMQWLRIGPERSRRSYSR
jgi:ankyrin repeat protein